MRQATEYAARYRDAPDELLIELASEADGLVTEARRALAAELRARNISTHIADAKAGDEYGALVPSGSWYDFPLRVLLAVVFLAGAAGLNGVITLGVAELPRWLAIAIIPPQIFLAYWIIKKLKI